VDAQASANYPTTSDALSIRHTEGIFVGYRGYEKNHITPQYPFGFGLSYTNFRYSDLDISKVTSEDSVEVSFTLTNTGQRAGAEIAELYVGQRNPKIERPPKEHLPTLPVLVFSMHDEQVGAERAIRAGAQGYVMKQNALSHFFLAVQQALYLSDEMRRRVLL